MNQPDTVLYSTDGYKVDHRRQYPPNTTLVVSNMTARGSRLAGVKHVVSMGIPAVMAEIQASFAAFFGGDKSQMCADYQAYMHDYLGVDNFDISNIEALYDLGYLPVECHYAPEGTLVDIRCPFFVIHNTHDDFAWVTNWLETWISAEIWKRITASTIAHEYRKMFDYYGNKTGAPAWFPAFQGHDFSARGLSGRADWITCGVGHLASFTGTDNLLALQYVRQNYDYTAVVGMTVPATEHSVMCAGGNETELSTYERLLELYPSGIVSIVSDTWDYWNVLTSILPSLKSRIMAREGKLVIRPDSGDPVKIICGDPNASPNSPEWLGSVRVLDQVFGTTTNQKGYKELDSHIGLIYGDSISPERAYQILSQLEALGYASSNVVFGIGSYTYQYVTRDTFMQAMKATLAKVDGKIIHLFKTPKTDDGTKNSLKGGFEVAFDEATNSFRMVRDDLDSVSTVGYETWNFQHPPVGGKPCFDLVRERLSKAREIVLRDYDPTKQFFA